MTDEQLEIVRLRDDFYQDGFYKIVAALLMIIAAITILIFICFYLISQRPAPVTFHTDNEWHVFAPVPLDQPYLTQADLLQWVSEILPISFNLDFLQYDKELEQLKHFYTPNGWEKLMALLIVYANSTTIQNSRLYVHAAPSGAPTVVRQTQTAGRYEWSVRMPLSITMTGVTRNTTQSVELQALVIRIPTLNDLSGVAIDDLVVAPRENKVQSNA